MLSLGQSGGGVHGVSILSFVPVCMCECLACTHCMCMHAHRWAYMYVLWRPGAWCPVPLGWASRASQLARRSQVSVPSAGFIAGSQACLSPPSPRWWELSLSCVLTSIFPLRHLPRVINIFAVLFFLLLLVNIQSTQRGSGARRNSKIWTRGMKMERKGYLCVPVWKTFLPIATCVLLLGPDCFFLGCVVVFVKRTSWVPVLNSPIRLTLRHTLSGMRTRGSGSLGFQHPNIQEHGQILPSIPLSTFWGYWYLHSWYRQAF